MIKTFALALLTCTAIGCATAGVHVARDRTLNGGKPETSLLLAAGSWVAAPITSGVSVVIMPVTQLVASMGMEHRAAARGPRAQR